MVDERGTEPRYIMAVKSRGMGKAENDGWAILLNAVLPPLGDMSSTLFRGGTVPFGRMNTMSVYQILGIRVASFSCFAVLQLCTCSLPALQ